MTMTRDGVYRLPCDNCQHQHLTKDGVTVEPCKAPTYFNTVGSSVKPARLFDCGCDDFELMPLMGPTR